LGVGMGPMGRIRPIGPMWAIRLARFRSVRYSPSMLPLFFLAAALGAEPGPLAIETPTVDLGELPANKPLAHVFKLKNTGAAPLTITEVTGVCGCIRQALGSRRLNPGETTELTIGVNLLTQPEGPNSWKLAVRYATATDPPTIGDGVVQVSAKVKKDVSVEPVAMMLSAEHEISGSLTVTDRRGKPLTVTGVRLGLKDVRADLKPAEDADGKRSQKIELTVTDACPPGQYADDICIDTNDPEYKELRIPLRVLKKSPAAGVQAAPSSANLRFAKEQTTASALVRLRDADDREVAIEKVEADHPAVSCKWAAGPGTMATLRVTVELKETRAAGVAVVTLHLKGKETILVPVSWTVP
jgi:hypothetical protein